MTSRRYQVRSRSDDGQDPPVYQGGLYGRDNVGREYGHRRGSERYDSRNRYSVEDEQYHADRERYFADGYEADPYYGDDYDRPPADGWPADLHEDEPVGTRIGRRTAKLRERKQRKKDRRRSAFALAMVITVFGVLTVGGWWGYTKIRDFIAPPDYDGKGTGEVFIQVHSGDSAADIGNTLVKKDVVKSAQAFTEAAAADSRSTSLQPGTYKMRKKMKASLALDLLLDPASRVTRRFTIPEGKSVRQTFAIISEKVGISTGDLEAAANDTSALNLPAWARGDLSGIDRLEGFLFPDTYDLEPKMGAKDVLQMMVARANQAFTDLNFERDAQATGHNPYDVLLIASMIEGEGITSDFGKISRVVYNRLDHEPPFLNFDSTTQYWLEKTGKGRKKHLAEADLHDPANNYSTSANRGLPPTAISNPGKDALKAALNPEPGPWMYFVLVDENGTSAFAETQEEQDANIEICREKNLGC